MKKQNAFARIEECYRILGVPPDASLDEVKQRYRTLAKLYHPDAYGSGVLKSLSKDEATEHFRKITEAYKTIVEFKFFEKTFKEAEKSVFSDEFRSASKSTFDDEKSHAQNFYQEKAYRKNNPSSGFKSPTTKRLDIRKMAIMAVVLLTLGFVLFVRLDTPRKQVVNPSNKIVTVSSGSSLSGMPSSKPSLPARESISSVLPAAPSRSFFTINSTDDEVLAVQGVPSRKSGQVWHYGLSKVMFRDGRVVGYDNFDGSLKVRLIPKREISVEKIPEYFTLGSSQDEVLLVQGTPSKIVKDVWHYGLDRVFFKEENGERVVNGYDNLTGSLKVRVVPGKIEDSVALRRGYFTVGDSQDDVVAVQGTPQKVEQNRWFYGAFYVVFDSRGRVVNVGPVPGDGGGVLKFMANRSSGQSGGGDGH
jgi:hypothetical protein